MSEKPPDRLNWRWNEERDELDPLSIALFKKILIPMAGRVVPLQAAAWLITTWRKVRSKTLQAVFGGDAFRRVNYGRCGWCLKLSHFPQ